jgi:glycosyltransferase involved in cell wall biosynthesis
VLKSSYKLGFISGSLAWGGLEMNQLRSALCFAEKGYNVSVLCKINSQIKIEAEKHNIPVIIIPEHKRYRYFFAGLKLAKIINHEKFTHLIARDSKDLNICAIAKTFSRNKFHLSYFMEMQIGVSKRSFLHTARFNKIDVWVCPLNYLKNQVVKLTKYNHKKIHVIPSFVNFSEEKKTKEQVRNELNISTFAFVFALIGRIDQQKGQLEAVKAFHLLNKTNTYLLIIGSPTLNENNNYLNTIKEYIIQHKLTDSVLFFDHIENITSYYSGFDVCLMTSKSETFGMVTIESLSNGIPVIGSNTGGTPELLQHRKYGLLYDVSSIEDLVLKMEDIINKKEMFKAEDLINYAKNFSKEIIIKKIEHLIF